MIIFHISGFKQEYDINKLWCIVNLVEIRLPKTFSTLYFQLNFVTSLIRRYSGNLNLTHVLVQICNKKMIISYCFKYL